MRGHNYARPSQRASIKAHLALRIHRCDDAIFGTLSANEKQEVDNDGIGDDDIGKRLAPRGSEEGVTLAEQ